MPLLVVYVLVRIYWLAYGTAGVVLDELWEQAAAQVVLWVLPCVAVTMVWRRASAAEAWRELGLARGVGAGLAFGLATSMPMAVVAILEADGGGPGLQRFLADCVLGPFTESVVFSGFLLTHLTRRSHWSPTPAVVACGLTFGLAHLTDADRWFVDGLIRLLVVGNTDALVQFFTLIVPRILAFSTGGLLFTWLFYRWSSLWPAIGLHAAMNFWWAISTGASVQAAQAASFGLAVIVTVYWTRRTAKTAVACEEPERSTT